MTRSRAYSIAAYAAEAILEAAGCGNDLRTGVSRPAGYSPVLSNLVQLRFWLAAHRVAQVSGLGAGTIVR